MITLSPASLDADRIRGARASAICAQWALEGVTHAVTVPDFVQFSIHDRLATQADGIRQVFACTEDQAITTAAGLHVGGAKPVVLVQNQGLYKGMNSLRAVCIDARIPLVLMVGQFGREEDNLAAPMRQSRRSMVRLLEPVLDAFEVPHWTLDTDADLPVITQAFEASRARATAAVVVVGRCTQWS